MNQNGNALMMKKLILLFMLRRDFILTVWTQRGPAHCTGRRSPGVSRKRSSWSPRTTRHAPPWWMWWTGFRDRCCCRNSKANGWVPRETGNWTRQCSIYSGKQKKYSQSKWLIKGANIYWNIFKCKGKLVSDVARTESTISHRRVSWKMLSMNMGRQ